MSELKNGIAAARRGHLFLLVFAFVLGGGAAAYGAYEGTRTGLGLAGLGGLVIAIGLGFLLKTLTRPWGRKALQWIECDPLPVVWVYPRQKGAETSMVVCRRDGTEASIPLDLGVDVDAILDELRTGPLPHARFGYRDEWAVEFRKNPSGF